MYLENYEIAILVKMYDEQVIGKAGYKSISMCQVYKDSTPNCVVKHGLGWGSSTVQTE